MHVPTRPVTRNVIRARMDRIDLMTRVLGCESDPERGRLLGLTDKTIRRAREGIFVGGIFVANTIAGLRAHERELAARNLRPVFDELFEVLVLPASAVGEAAA